MKKIASPLLLVMSLAGVGSALAQTAPAAATFVAEAVFHHESPVVQRRRRAVKPPHGLVVSARGSLACRGLALR